MALILLLVLVAAACLGLSLLLKSTASASRSEPPATMAEVADDASSEDRSTSLDVVYRSEYLDTDIERASLTLDDAGLPTARLKLERNRLVLTTAEGWINPKSRSLARVGLYSFQIRGTSYYEDAHKAGDFRPRKPVTLLREPQNLHDSNAIAVISSGQTVGYVNKQNAARLAKRIDAGEDIVAISTRGGGPGEESVVPYLLAAERTVMEHLLRPR